MHRRLIAACRAKPISWRSVIRFDANGTKLVSAAEAVATLTNANKKTITVRFTIK